MNKLLVNKLPVVTLLILAVASGCAKKKTTDTGVSFQNDLYGKSFVTACNNSSGNDQTQTTTFNSTGTAGSIVIASFMSNQGICSGANMTLEIDFTGVLGTLDATTGAFTTTLTISAIKITPNSPTTATALTQGSACGLTNWTSGQQQDVSADNCSALFGANGPAVGGQQFGTSWLTVVGNTVTLTSDASGDTGGCSGNDDSSSSKRCTVEGTATADIQTSSL